MNLRKYAELLFWGMTQAYGKEYHPGANVIVRYGLPAMPLVEEVYKLLIEKNINVAFSMIPTAFMEKSLYSIATDEYLSRVNLWDRTTFSMADGYMCLLAEESLDHLKDANQEKIAIAAKARKQLRSLLDAREKIGQFGWTLGAYPTQANADECGVSLEEYSNRIMKACHIDKEDPVAFWQNLKIKADKTKAWLNEITKDTEYFHVTGEGTNLKIFPGEKRIWAGVSGHNIPSYELFTSPDCRLTEGTYYANEMAFRDGNKITDIRLTFEKGRVIKATATEGEEYLNKQLTIDDTANLVGEFSLTDASFSPIEWYMADILYDENKGGKYGNCHIAVGSSYPETYDGDISIMSDEDLKVLGFNDSALHWDVINTLSRDVVAHMKDGSEKLIYKDGSFLI